MRVLGAAAVPDADAVQLLGAGRRARRGGPEGQLGRRAARCRAHGGVATHRRPRGAAGRRRPGAVPESPMVINYVAF